MGVEGPFRGHNKTASDAPGYLYSHNLPGDDSAPQQQQVVYSSKEWWVFLLPFVCCFLSQLEQTVTCLVLLGVSDFVLVDNSRLRKGYTTFKIVVVFVLLFVCWVFRLLLLLLLLLLFWSQCQQTGS